jgi:hypothetical protein
MIVDLLDEEDKKKDLLSAWNGFKIEVRSPSSIICTGGLVVEIRYQQRGQFPELVPTSIGTEYAGIAGGRVLNAKHQTSRSSRPRRQVLDRVAAAASNSSWSHRNPPTTSLPSHPPLNYHRNRTRHLLALSRSQQHRGPATDRALIAVSAHRFSNPCR